jgi:hypothetical protein
MISIIADFTATAQVILLAQRKKSRKAPPFETKFDPLEIGKGSNSDFRER